MKKIKVDDLNVDDLNVSERISVDDMKKIRGGASRRIFDKSNKSQLNELSDTKIADRSVSDTQNVLKDY